jgi:hypothetical protein
MDLSGYSFKQQLSDLLLPKKEYYATVNPAYLNSGGVYVLEVSMRQGKRSLYESPGQ